jgi:hypothetical protein
MKTQILKTNLKLAAITLLLLTTACGCVKDNLQDELPPITQTGENTFGCVIDGQVLIPQDKEAEFFTPIGGISRGIQTGGGGQEYWTLSANNYSSLYIYIYIPSLKKGEDVYPIGNSNGLSIARVKLDVAHIWCNSRKKRYLSIAGTGNITITRLDKNIWSGLFSCRAVNRADPSDIIEITDGRFDIGPDLYDD